MFSKTSVFVSQKYHALSFPKLYYTSNVLKRMKRASIFERPYFCNCVLLIQALDLPGGETIEDIAESVDELREKLANMKRLMEEKRGSTLGEISAKKRKETSDIIDGNFLSWIFGSALIVILSVSFYAFYNLYHAVLKKFPSHHTEL